MRSFRQHMMGKRNHFKARLCSALATAKEGTRGRSVEQLTPIERARLEKVALELEALISNWAEPPEYWAELYTYRMGNVRRSRKGGRRR